MSDSGVTRRTELEALVARSEAQRRELAREVRTVEAEVAKVDGWLSIARRATPAVAVGLVAATVVAGPARVGRWFRTAVVPVLLIRQFLAGRR